MEDIYGHEEDRMWMQLSSILFTIVYCGQCVSAQCDYSAVDKGEYIGCFFDNNVRLFPYTWKNFPFANMTLDYCFLVCINRGFKYAGTQSRYYCHCGDDPWRDPVQFPQVSESDCNRPCNGNTSQTCGGEWRLSIYRLKQPISPPHSNLYDTIIYGSGLTADPLKIVNVYGTDMASKVSCARECGHTQFCSVFSIASATNQCFLFEGHKLCDIKNADVDSSIFYLQ